MHGSLHHISMDNIDISPKNHCVFHLIRDHIQCSAVLMSFLNKYLDLVSSDANNAMFCVGQFKQD